MYNLRHWIDLHCWQFVAVAWVLCCLLLFLIEIVPRANMLSATYKAYQTSKAEVLKMNEWEVNSRQLTNEAKALEEEVNALYISIPRNDQMSVILDCLQEGSQGKAVALQQIRTGPPALYATHQEQPISVIAKGDFHAIGAFIDTIEQSPYLIKVASLQIKRDGRLKESLNAALQLNAIVVDR